MQSGINKIKRLSNMNSDEGIQYFLHLSRFMVKKKMLMLVMYAVNVLRK